MDLLDFWRGRLSPRRLAVLITGLPSESATIRALSGDAADWTLTNHLLADVFAALTGKDHPVREEVNKQATADRDAERLLTQRRRLERG